MTPTLLVEVYSRKLYQAELPRDGLQKKIAGYKCFDVGRAPTRTDGCYLLAAPAFRIVAVMGVLEEGQGKFLAWYAPDEERKWVKENKTRAMKDKRMSLRRAVSLFVRHGDYLALGGFGHVRTSMATVHEIVRQKIHRLTVAANPGVHDTDILIAGSCVDEVEAAYAFGHELRGLSPCSRRAVESGRVRVAAEVSNAALQWRFKAAAMGLPFIPTRVMLGTGTFDHSSARAIKDPFTGKTLCLVPACYPDVAAIHVHACDKYGNSRIDGITVKDIDLAKAARRLIITTEKVVGEEEIREKPWNTAIPFFLVDAVVEAPYGVHPGNMPGIYYSDEEHMAEWLSLSRTDEGVGRYLERYIYGTEDLDEYLQLVGGAPRLERLRLLEALRIPLKAPWVREGTKLGKQYTTMDLMVCAASRILEDEKSVLVGTGLPMMAASLAQRTHAPNLLIIFEAGSVGPRIPTLPISVGDSRTSHEAVMAGSMDYVMSSAQLGYVDYAFLGAAQIDPYGNINTTVIGRHDLPTVRLPGSGGGNDAGSLCWRSVVLMNQDRRRFVEKVDFVTTPGHRIAGLTREQVGLPEETGPYRVVTQLGVMGFDEETGKMGVLALHPGVKMEDIRASTGFELPILAELTTTTPPNAEELRILREEIDPARIVRG